MNIAVLCSPELENNQIFDEDNEYNYFVSLEPLRVLKKDLEKEGHLVQTIDLYDNIEDIDVAFVYFTFTTSFIHLLRLIKKNPTVRIIYYMIEPEMIIAMNNKKILQFLNIFDTVLTYRDDYVDNEEFVKIYYSQKDIKKIRKKIPFRDKKFLTIILSWRKARFSVGEDDLYGERVNIVDYFAKNDKIDIYGKKWEFSENEDIKRNFQGMFRGPKHEVFSKYKFCTCFENQRNVPGWISEKIFDALTSGCVPVYYGANNVEDYVDKSCFIDFRDFDNYRELEAFLEKINEKEYNKYIKNIEKYLKSDKYEKWLPDNFSKIVRKEIKKGRLDKKKSFCKIKLRLLWTFIRHPKRVMNRSQKKVPFFIVFYW